MFSSVHGNGNGSNDAAKKDPAEKRGQPLSFEEMGKQLKAHIEEFQKLAVPVGPPANPQVQQPTFMPGLYPHPNPAAATPQPKVYHPSKFTKKKSFDACTIFIKFVSLSKNLTSITRSTQWKRWDSLMMADG